ncbi:glycerate kinase family protein [Desertivirga arenae]|uniref:glycerate kinase family protein n=1 Tax=Desertivirga arenae TaxID=2810309 RepID=UPI001A968C22|nr:glycerate kinase [Pedobacter sp. SYSU D00823]
MKILIAPDKFKGSLSSYEAGKAIKSALASTIPAAELRQIPMADGGDGLLEVLQATGSYIRRDLTVCDPLFRPIEASYLITKNNAAIIEMAKASGLLLLKTEERNPLVTSSYGTGQLIEDAIQKGAVDITLGIGGSATNDAGTGMAAALGFRFYDQWGKEIVPIGENLIRITKIDHCNAINLSTINIKVACDVTNVFHGKDGAAWVFGPQKGADENSVRILDEGLDHLASLLRKDLGVDVQSIPGAGAAGGLGGGAIAFLGAKLLSGIELILEYTQAEELIIDSDLVITGEGKLDHQSLNGKVISGISSLSKRHNKPLIVLCGENELLEEEYKAAGITQVNSIMEHATDALSAFDNSLYWLEFTTKKAIKEFL